MTGIIVSICDVSKNCYSLTPTSYLLFNLPDSLNSPYQTGRNSVLRNNLIFLQRHAGLCEHETWHSSQCFVLIFGQNRSLGVYKWLFLSIRLSVCLVPVCLSVFMHVAYKDYKGLIQIKWDNSGAYSIDQDCAKKTDHTGTIGDQWLKMKKIWNPSRPDPMRPSGSYLTKSGTNQDQTFNHIKPGGPWGPPSIIVYIF